MRVFNILFIILVSIPCFAGGDGHGGKWTEGDLKHFLTRLAPYVASAEGQALWPEVVAYDRAHPEETFETVLSELTPSLVNQPVYDVDGHERDCISGFDKIHKIRYFQCNSDALPSKPDDKRNESEKSPYYGSLYRLVLHEGFVQVGLEQPIKKVPLVGEIPSEYHLSSRLLVHLEYFPEWVPGADKSAAYADPKCSMVCGTVTNLVRGLGLTMYVHVTPVAGLPTPDASMNIPLRNGYNFAPYELTIAQSAYDTGSILCRVIDNQTGYHNDGLFIAKTKSDAISIAHSIGLTCD